MKKRYVILINLTIFLVLFFILNFVFEKNADYISLLSQKFVFKNINKYAVPFSYSDYPLEDDELSENLEKLEYTEDLYNKFCGEKRIEYGLQYADKLPVVVFGCSYAYGHGLKKEETFSYLLSNSTKRPVYSFAKCGSQLFESFNDMNTPKYKNVIKNADYFIYIYMYDHIRRYLFQPLYMNIENEFSKEKSHTFFDKIYLIKYITSSIRLQKMFGKKSIYTNCSQYLKKIILEYNKKIKEQNPNAKFIVIVYNDKIPKSDSTFVADIINSDIWEEITEQSDIQVVKTKDLLNMYFDKQYKLEADISAWHPNAKAWSKLTPKFAEKYIK